MFKRAVIVGVLTVFVSGCAHDAEWMQRQPAIESTIGNDPNNAPAGRVIPPPGMGVDMGAITPDLMNALTS